MPKKIIKPIVKKLMIPKTRHIHIKSEIEQLQKELKHKEKQLKK